LQYSADYVHALCTTSCVHYVLLRQQMCVLCNHSIAVCCIERIDSLQRVQSVCVVRYSVRDDGTHLNRVVGVVCWAHRKPGRHQSACSNRPATCTAEHTWKRVSAADARTKRQQLRLVEPLERNSTHHRVERCGRRSVFVRNRRTRWWGVARERMVIERGAVQRRGRHEASGLMRVRLPRSTGEKSVAPRVVILTRRRLVFTAVDTQSQGSVCVWGGECGLGYVVRAHACAWGGLTLLWQALRSSPLCCAATC
jgi:hypothetical protein